MAFTNHDNLDKQEQEGDSNHIRDCTQCAFETLITKYTFDDIKDGHPCGPVDLLDSKGQKEMMVILTSR